MIQQQIAVILWIALTAISGIESAYRFSTEGPGSLWAWLLLAACLFSLVMVFRSRKTRAQKFGVGKRSGK
ncbi:MAG: hypothetical protein KJS92_00810 [Bacteroidetes bacterium]|nr:hypothetical protein [Bacteroidota bacterium]